MAKMQYGFLKYLNEKIKHILVQPKEMNLLQKIQEDLPRLHEHVTFVQHMFYK